MTELPDKCPSCGIEWKEDKNIYEFAKDVKGMEPKEAAEYAKQYGCTKESPRHFYLNVAGMYCMETDRTTHYKCLNCEQEHLTPLQSKKGAIND